MSELKDKIYVGDGVYLSNDGYHLVLTTEDAYGASNTIYLEPEMLKTIQNYLDKLKES